MIKNIWHTFAEIPKLLTKYIQDGKGIQGSLPYKY